MCNFLSIEYIYKNLKPNILIIDTTKYEVPYISKISVYEISYTCPTRPNILELDINIFFSYQLLICPFYDYFLYSFFTFLHTTTMYNKFITFTKSSFITNGLNKD